MKSIAAWICFACLGAICPRQSDAADSTQVERKQSPSKFEIGDLNKLMMAAIQNSSNQVKFATPPGEYIVHGRVLDDQGQPIPAAQVMLADNSHGLDRYLANFDVTDQSGRFVVQAAPNSQTVFVCANEMFYSMQTGGGEDVVVRIPATYLVSFDKGDHTDLLDDKLTVKAREYQVGTTTVLGDFKTTIRASKAGDFRLAPGKYLVSGRRKLETTGDPVSGRIELAEIEVVAKDHQSFRLGDREGTKLTGTIGDYDSLMKNADVIGIQLSLSISQIESQNEWRTIDTTTCNSDGTFTFAAVPTGPALLRVTTISAPRVAPQGAFGFSPSADRTLFKERIDVAGDAMQLDLPIQRVVNRTADQVHKILDSENPSPNVSWSWHDVQISQLARLDDREGTIAELHRLLKADDTPYSWRYLVIESLWRIRPIQASSKTALVQAMKDPVNRRWRSSILGTLRDMAGEAIEMVDLIISMRDDEDWRVRYGVADAMGEIGKAMITPSDEMIDAAIGLLDDPHGLVRRQAAGSLGELHSPRASEALRARMDDPFGPARAMAAWALWECSGEVEPSLSTMIDLLQTGDHEARKEAAYYLQMFDHRAAAALPALQANTDYEKKPPFMGTRETIRYQLKGAAERAIEAIEAGIGWQAEAQPFALRIDAAQQARVNVMQFDAAWGTVAEGLELGILIDGEQESYALGQRIPIKLLLRNATDMPIRFEVDRRLHDSGPEVSSVSGKRQYVTNTRLLVTPQHLVATLPAGGVMEIPHTGLGLGRNPDPRRRLWHPYIAKPVAGKHQVSQRYRFEVYNEPQGTKTRVWLTSGAMEVGLLQSDLDLSKQ